MPGSKSSLKAADGESWGSVKKALESAVQGGQDTTPTWLTPPESLVHITSFLASPTVLPWKSTPLWDRDATMSTCPGRCQGWEGGEVVAPCPYVISWALSWGFFRSSSDSRQFRKLSRVTSGLGLTVILSRWFHTSKPIRATRRRRGW